MHLMLPPPPSPCSPACRRCSLLWSSCELCGAWAFWNSGGRARRSSQWSFSVNRNMQSNMIKFDQYVKHSHIIWLDHEIAWTWIIGIACNSNMWNNRNVKNVFNKLCAYCTTTRPSRSCIFGSHPMYFCAYWQRDRVHHIRTGWVPNLSSAV